MLRQSLEEWRIEGYGKCGGDVIKLRFRCPACGHVASVQDFLDLGADVDDAYQECIGRVNKKGADGMKGIDNGDGCNWAAYGLFGTLGKGRIVVKDDGKEVEVFDFAD